jgi:hypothetical protein
VTPAVDAVALVARLRVLVPLTIVAVLAVEVGTAVTVAVADDSVAFVSKYVVTPVLVTEGVVLDVGACENVPMAYAPVALVVRLRVLPPLLIVIAGLLEYVGRAENAPVWVAGVGMLALKVVALIFTDGGLPLTVVELRVPTVPVAFAVPPNSMLQSFFRVCFGFLGTEGIVARSGSSLCSCNCSISGASSAMRAPRLRFNCWIK